MWLLAAAIYIGCKWLTWRRTAVPGAPWWWHAGYLLTWPGMDASAFLYRSANAEAPRDSGGWGGAVVRVLAGIVLFWGVAGWVPPTRELLAGWIGMIGIVLILHFGLFQLLSEAWRSVGHDAHPIMDSPFLSVSVSEFWGRRWNTAFRDLTHRFVFRPLVRVAGPMAALWIGFLVSGLLHELVITVPASPLCAPCRGGP
jgi:alginate O-acetyltransferase complex protein AlgI